ncbi:DUF2529 domain-containing protein [Sutcliffiella rhizosphaerae]|uniref:DUF2529 domain-containing protein n=1 Tax=Sutcliffiella rhizosphaerae TaxID=2880967 RepID=A0ABN8A8J3_9BACI|nr:DUF2529 domain-containing protein [Sutcliffiella rhizosphaerae]CAG9620106.1 hypothetical protein BACCIP111883_00874 [Sutcliffiella rhizosphaerae]
MLKIFTTQLQGIYNKMGNEEDLALEDGARMLAQAVVGEGRIYIYGVKEMKAVEAEAIDGAEPMDTATLLSDLDNYHDLTDTDRALIVSRFSTDNEAVSTAKALKELGIEMVGISTVVDGDSAAETLESIVDVHIDLKLKKPLIPGDDGERYGFPSSMAALYAYFGLSFTLREMLEEQE